MSQGISLTGMVLSAVPSGDYDKRVVLLTGERGKITAFARGARRQNSVLLAAVSPFSFGSFTLYEGRTAYTLVSAEISNYFEQVKADLEAVYYGYYFMEFADYYGRENLDASQMLNLLYASLRALEKGQLPDALIRYVFEVKLMVLNGEFPQDIVRNGMLSETARYTLDYIIRAPIRNLFAFTVTDAVLHEIAGVQDKIRRKYTDRDFKTLEMLNLLLKM